MKQIHHKQNETYRVIQRGVEFRVQQKNRLASRQDSGWDDIGHIHSTSEQAVAAMYSRVPLTKAVA